MGKMQQKRLSSPGSSCHQCKIVKGEGLIKAALHAPGKKLLFSPGRPDLIRPSRKEYFSW